MFQSNMAKPVTVHNKLCLPAPNLDFHYTLILLLAIPELMLTGITPKLNNQQIVGLNEDLSDV